MFFRRSLNLWLADAREWPADTFTTRTATAGELFAKAKAIIDDSGAAARAFGDEGQYIRMLRAAGYLQAALGKEPQAIWRGEALLLLGVATAATAEPLLWDLDSLFLEACVREEPHSAIAVRCVDRMYDRAWFTWAGSSSDGDSIPRDVAQRLGELRVLAR